LITTHEIEARASSAPKGLDRERIANLIRLRLASEQPDQADYLSKAPEFVDTLLVELRRLREVVDLQDAYLDDRQSYLEIVNVLASTNRRMGELKSTLTRARVAMKAALTYGRPPATGEAAILEWHRAKKRIQDALKAIAELTTTVAATGPGA
jgi:hypothetical protein